jgi:hypothetical protein
MSQLIERLFWLRRLRQMSQMFRTAWRNPLSAR